MTEHERAMWLRVAMHFDGHGRRVRREVARLLADQGDPYTWALHDFLRNEYGRARTRNQAPGKELH